MIQESKAPGYHGNFNSFTESVKEELHCFSINFVFDNLSKHLIIGNAVVSIFYVDHFTSFVKLVFESLNKYCIPYFTFDSLNMIKR